MMSMKKWGVALLLAGAFGLVGCESTTEASSDNEISCKITSDANSVTQTYRYLGMKYTEEYRLQDDYAVTTKTYKNVPQADIDDDCYDDTYDFGSEYVTCSGNTIVIYDYYPLSLGQIESSLQAQCNAMMDGGDDYAY